MAGKILDLPVSQQDVADLSDHAAPESPAPDAAPADDLSGGGAYHIDNEGRKVRDEVK
jgi:hypothetical protein